MTLEVEEGYEDILEESEYLMVEVEGGLVPFFVTENGINFRTSSAVTLAFDGLDSAEKVRNYCGSKVFLHKDTAYEPETSDELDELNDYLVFDLERGQLGKIIHVDNFSGNIVLTILHKGKELLIPFSEELITNLDETKKELHLDCPEGLIDLYME